MRINDKQRDHGAALYQIAEHPQFTAINVLTVDGERSNSAFQINNNIAVYPKVASKPQGGYKEYYFTFTRDQLKELAAITTNGIEIYLALVCRRTKPFAAYPMEN